MGQNPFSLYEFLNFGGSHQQKQSLGRKFLFWSYIGANSTSGALTIVQIIKVALPLSMARRLLTIGKKSAIHWPSLGSSGAQYFSEGESAASRRNTGSAGKFYAPASRIREPRGPFPRVQLEASAPLP
jgi:hypothetical protein